MSQLQQEVFILEQRKVFIFTTSLNNEVTGNWNESRDSALLFLMGVFLPLTPLTMRNRVPLLATVRTAMSNLVTTPNLPRRSMLLMSA